MNLSDRVLKKGERALFELRELYQQYGYTRFKVSKFEEYDLYAHNKSFLVSENILTFTDTNGRLMALKPDVTLSIVKNIGNEDSSVHKLYYNENVYRTSQGSDGFCEIMQTGLECIGEIDLYAIGEVLMLAQKSLALISNDYILDLSHLGFLTGLFEQTSLDSRDTETLLGMIGNKNIPAIASLCRERCVDEGITRDLCALTDLYAPLDEALKIVRPMVRGERMQAAYEQLCGVSDMMRVCGESRCLYLDFSIVNDMSYYTGIIFRGFINGIPNGVLSGGRYDSLLQKMGKQNGAIGFAVYLDLLERFGAESSAYDVDTLLVYDDETAPETVIGTAAALRATGKTVLAQKGSATTVRCRERLSISKGGLKILEAND